MGRATNRNCRGERWHREIIISRNREKNRRHIAVFMLGRRPKQMVPEFSGVDRMRESLNYRFLEAGLSYPTYYKGLFLDLRGALTYAASRAREANLEIWAEDHTNTGPEVEGPE